MAITDLTGYTWIGNDSINLYGSSSIYTYHLNFTCADVDYNEFVRVEYKSIPSNQSITYYPVNSSSGISVYNQNGWVNQTYKIINITGGQNVTTSGVISWFQSHGTLIPTPPQSSPKFLTTSNKLINKIDGHTIKKVILGDVSHDIVPAKSSAPEPQGETWVINNFVETIRGEYNINFTSNSNNYTIFSLSYARDGATQYIKYDEIKVYETTGGRQGWYDQTYRTVYFPIPPTGDLRTWLQSNANLQ